jgi:hypothetical protein
MPSRTRVSERTRTMEDPFFSGLHVGSPIHRLTLYSGKEVVSGQEPWVLCAITEHDIEVLSADQSLRVVAVKARVRTINHRSR